MLDYPNPQSNKMMVPRCHRCIFWEHTGLIKEKKKQFKAKKNWPVITINSCDEVSMIEPQWLGILSCIFRVDSCWYYFYNLHWYHHIYFKNWPIALNSVYLNVPAPGRQSDKTICELNITNNLIMFPHYNILYNINTTCWFNHQISIL